MTSVLFCGGLSKDVTEDHLRDLLSRHGRVRNVKLRIVGGVSTGQASALLTADGGITKALNALNGSPIGRGRLKVRVQDDQDQSRVHAQQRRAQNPAYGAGNASSSFDELMQGYLAERQLVHAGEIRNHHTVLPHLPLNERSRPQASPTRFLISGIAPSVTKDQIGELFATYGAVDAVNFGRKEGKLTGSGEVLMTCNSPAESVRDILHDAPLNDRKLKVHIPQSSPTAETLPRSPHVTAISAAVSAAQTERFLLNQQPETHERGATGPAVTQASLLQGLASTCKNPQPGLQHLAGQTPASGLQPPSTTTQLIVDLLADDDNGADTCAIPPLGFGIGSSSSSGSSSRGGSGEMADSGLASHSTISVGNVGAADAAALGLALGRLMPTQSAEEVEFALQTLMLLPPKQRKMCLFNPAWLKIKVKAALALLQAEPMGVCD